MISGGPFYWMWNGFGVNRVGDCSPERPSVRTQTARQAVNRHSMLPRRDR